ncbi:unnamed protein product [Linum tenue]|uniref:Pentatricopeptide repeat-containing protein n=1 Tax=Linum tenue TaxID=586396 RepID=A0AAV0LSW9_9ROSI|nr:unnamed protein product [Linum tenue]
MVFDSQSQSDCSSNPILWNSILRANVSGEWYENALNLYARMRKFGNLGDGFTIPLVIRACRNLGCRSSKSSRLCQIVHSHAIEAGFRTHLHVSNELIGMYAKLGRMVDARKVFERMRVRTTLSWNMMVSGYSFNCDAVAALDIFRRMETEGLEPNLRPDIVSWSAVISGFATNQREEEALNLFRRMHSAANVTANAVMICSVLSACAELSALNLGKEIHGYMIRTFLSNELLVSNSLVDMYMKCGNLKEGHLVFERTEGKDVISWNSIIKGFGMYGLGIKALQMFDRMITSGHQPDGITFVAILSACSHAGLVDQGRLLFNNMVSKYGIEPGMEHYACTVDLLGRSGFLEEASEVVKKMPMEPNDCVLGALLNSCKMHTNTTFAENVVSRMSSLVSERPWSCTLMMNIYAGSGKWEDSAKERASARSKGLKKAAGRSWIEVKKKFHKFVAGDCLEEKNSGEIFRVLGGLTNQMEDISDDYVIFLKLMMLD